MKFFVKGIVAATSIALAATVALPAFAAWTMPSGTPPAGNVAAPLNTGSTTQIKSGNLGVLSLFASGQNGNGVFVDRGDCYNAGGLACLFKAYGGTPMFSVLNWIAPGVGAGLKVNSDGGVYLMNGTVPIPANRAIVTGADGRLTISNTGLLPAGTLDQTLRHDGTTWVATDTLKTSPDKVVIKNATVNNNPAPNPAATLSVVSTGTALSVKSSTASSTTPIAEFSDTSGQSVKVVENGTGPAKLSTPAFQLVGNGAGADKVLVSDTLGNGSWTSLSPIQIPVPDIKMVEDQWSDLHDNDSRTLSCPTDYAAISVSCDGNNDDGIDTCMIEQTYSTNEQDPPNAVNTWATSAASGKYRSARVSLGNTDPNGADMHAVLTCMRYQNYPIVSVLPSSGGQTGGSGSGSGSQQTGWTSVGSGGLQQGNVGQSCVAWLRGLYNDPSIVAADIRLHNYSGLGQHLVGKCGYRSTNGGTSTTEDANAVFPAGSIIPKYPTSDYSLEVNL
jgi:hypothetical protein